MLSNYGIKVRIAVVLLVVFGLATVFQVFYLTPRIVQQAVDREKLHQSEIARGIAASLDSTFAQAKAELEAMAALPGISSLQKDQLDKTIRCANATDQFFNYYFVMDRAGRWLSYPGREELVGSTVPRNNMD